ncbi:GNAT family N-acetyltransferase [Erythrobacter sp.]|uniref:GNAT family N-acetyltransferase n=1 Tax=Erythrobacter sp. TaxID=1042 RepID=UPI001B05C6A8|nr:GNAT family N-acetyltransferase [Erythrobacter sp.]MBO6525498.1 GNAT family N-acetyltransferase [Erythrobacter sp.]MBO6529829.1 GNAT family N-acetyltransferase [Erythrobacter sp.]
MTSTQSKTALIREAGAGDPERLSLVANATFLETFSGLIDGDALVVHCEKAHAPARFGDLLAAGARAWLAEIDGAPIGYALLTEPELDAARDGDVELKKIYLLSRFHGSGIARQLFDAALAGAQGNTRLVLGVKDDNRRAIAFYAKQGFKQIATRRFDVGGILYDDVVLARDLERTLPHE